MNKFILSLSILLASSGALACTDVSAVEAFADKVDRNQDGQISRREWRNMHLNNQFNRDFKRASLKTFKELDTNNDGKLDETEHQALENRISYANDTECDK